MKRFKKIGILFFVFGNVWSLAFVLTGLATNNVTSIGFLLSAVVVVMTYFSGLIRLLDELKPSGVHLALSSSLLPLIDERTAYMTYEVTDVNVSKADWDSFKIKLENYAEDFLKTHYPTIVLDLEFRLFDQSLDEKTNGRHVALNAYFGQFDHYIYLSDWLVHASLYYDDFSLVVPTLSHELVHYALFRLGKGYHDGEEDFEKELERLSLPSNYHRKVRSIHVARRDVDGKTMAEIYIDQDE
jgi:hypothetical protein